MEYFHIAYHSCIRFRDDYISIIKIDLYWVCYIKKGFINKHNHSVDKVASYVCNWLSIHHLAYLEIVVLFLEFC